VLMLKRGHSDTHDSTVHRGLPRATRRLRSWALAVAVTVLALLATPGAFAAPARAVALDLQAACANPAPLVGRPCFAVGLAAAAVPAGAPTITTTNTSLDNTNKVEVVATLAKPSTAPVQSLDTVLITGIVDGESKPGHIALSGASFERVSRLRGVVKDTSGPCAGAVFFRLASGAVQQALTNGKAALADLVSVGKIIGVSDPNGIYDVMLPLGAYDLMALYRDPKGVSKSMLWVISLDFGPETLQIDLGPKLAVLTW
jgi:hypothetical protein